MKKKLKKNRIKLKPPRIDPWEKVSLLNERDRVYHDDYHLGGTRWTWSCGQQYGADHEPYYLKKVR